MNLSNQNPKFQAWIKKRRIFHFKYILHFSYKSHYTTLSLIYLLLRNLTKHQVLWLPIFQEKKKFIWWQNNISYNGKRLWGMQICYKLCYAVNYLFRCIPWGWGSRRVLMRGTGVRRSSGMAGQGRGDRDGWGWAGTQALLWHLWDGGWRPQGAAMGPWDMGRIRGGPREGARDGQGWGSPQGPGTQARLNLNAPNSLLCQMLLWLKLYG